MKRPQSAKLFLASGFKNIEIQQTEIEKYEDKKRSMSSMTNIQLKPKIPIFADMKRPVSAMDYKEKNKQSALIDINTLPFQDYSKMRPVYIRKEKEALNDEKNQLITNIQTVKQENNKLKEKFTNLTSENSKINKDLSNLESYLSKKVGYDKFSLKKQENFFIIALKKNINQLTAELVEKSEQLSLLKKNPKVMKLEELQIEMKTFAQEAKRLKLLAEIQNDRFSEGSSKNDKGIVEKQEETIEKLLQEQRELDSTVQILNDQLFEIDIMKELEKNRNGSKRKDSEKARTVMNSKDKEIGKLNDDMKNLVEEIQALINDSQNEGTLKNKIQRLRNNEQQLKEKINQKEQIIAYQEKNIKELKSKTMEKSNFEITERKALQEKLTILKEKIQEIETKIKGLTALQNIEEKKKNEEIKQAEQNSETQEMMKDELYHLADWSKMELSRNDNNTENHDFEGKSYKRIPTIKSSDVKIIGMELNLRFKIMKIDVNTIIGKFLFTDKMKKKNYAKIVELIPVLMEEPFSIQTDENALLLARYLIEDNNEPFVQLDLKKTNKLATIQSIFKHVVGSYTILNHEDEKKIKEDIIFRISKYKNSIIQAFNDREETKDKTYVSFVAIEKVLSYLSIGLKAKHLDYIILQLFKLSNNLDILQLNKIFTIFAFESIDYRSPSPSPLRKNTTVSEENRPKSRTHFKFRTSVEESIELDRKKLNNNTKHLFFGQGFINDNFKTYYINNLTFKENNEINGSFFYNNESLQIKGEYQNDSQSIKFSAFPLLENYKKLEFDGSLLSKNSEIKGTLKSAGLEEDLTLMIVQKIWKYEMKCIINKNNYDFNGFMAFKNNNVEGKGVDELGEYSWKGMMERDLQITLNKIYKDNNRIRFEGMVQREKVVGHYEYEEEEKEFSMIYQEIL